MYEALERRDACAIIPPRKDAKLSRNRDDLPDRNDAIQKIERQGRKA